MGGGGTDTITSKRNYKHTKLFCFVASSEDGTKGPAHARQDLYQMAPSLQSL